MKKAIVVMLGLLLIMGLVGCKQRQKSAGDQLVEDISSNVVDKAVETAKIEEPAGPVTVEKPTAEEKQAAVQPEPEQETTESKEVAVTEEEIDDLLKSIESIDTEDLGGLSN